MHLDTGQVVSALSGAPTYAYFMVLQLFLSGYEFYYK